MRGPSNLARPTIFVVDDDAAVRDALKLLLRSVGTRWRRRLRAEFLDAYGEDRAGCLVLDIRMPGMSGLELQQKLNEKHSILPIIFITGHGDVPMAVEAMQAGAVDFIQSHFATRTSSIASTRRWRRTAATAPRSASATTSAAAWKR